MKRFTWCAIIALVLLPLAMQAQVPASDFVPGELIVKFTTASSFSARQHCLAALKAEHIRTFSLISAHHLRLGKGVTVDKAIELLSKTPFREIIEYAEPNYLYTAFDIPSDPLRGELWGLHNVGQTGGIADADIDALEAWQTTTGGSEEEIVVGCIDAGIDWQHEDLAANIWINPGESGSDGSGHDKKTNGIDDDGNGYIDDWHGWDFVNNDNDPTDDNGHGTHTAGALGAVGNNGIGIAGVSWSVKLLPIKFLGANGSGSTDNALKAVAYAASFKNGAGQNIVRILNNSWGGSRNSKALENAILSCGAIFVAAAGNGGCDCKSYPAANSPDNIIAVAATDASDGLASFSNYNASWVDLAAPGAGIVSTLPGNKYGSASGTSMSAPLVAGVAALLRAQHPGWSNTQIKSRILLTVDPLPSLQGKMVTGGRLNAATAVGGVALAPDITAPSDVTTLTAGSVTEISIDLQWTATGDDGNTGTAYMYDIRYLAGTPVTAANWSSATQVKLEPGPHAAGTPEYFTVGGLAQGTTYYFALKVADELGNWSGISNGASGTTAIPLWNTEFIQAGVSGIYLSHAYSPSGSPAVAFGDGTNDDAKYASWNGSSWTIETVDGGSDVTAGIDLAYNPADGEPSVSYGWGLLKFAHRNGGSWTATTLETKNANNDVTSLAYAPGGGASISYQLVGKPATSAGLKFAKQDPTTGAWTKQIVEQGAAARYSSLAYDPAGNPSIAYSDEIDNDGMLETLKFARFNPTTQNWSTQIVETGTVGFGVFVTLAYDPTTGYPAIAHRGTDVRFLRWNGTGWDLEIVDNCCRYYGGLSLAYTSDGTAYLSYVDLGSSPHILKFAKRVAPSAWTIETVERGSVGSFRTSLRFSPTGLPTVGYYASGLKFARRPVAPFAPGGGSALLTKTAGDGETGLDQRDVEMVDGILNHTIGDVPVEVLLSRLRDPAFANQDSRGHASSLITLGQNYPNPFNPETVISFTIPEAGNVLLRVFDMHGRQVAELVNGGQEAGMHGVTFDGASLPSGMYLYRLEAQGVTRTGRMLLMK